MSDGAILIICGTIVLVVSIVSMVVAMLFAAHLDYKTNIKEAKKPFMKPGVSEEDVADLPD